MNFTKILKETLTFKFDKAFGLDIGDHSIEVIELEKVFKFSVYTYGRTELPEGVVKNGLILDQNILAEKLKKLLKDVKPKVSTNKVIVSLPESQVYVRCIEVDANLKSGALIKEITDKVSLSLPVNLDKTYWDFIQKPLADKTKKLIMFISVPKDIANGYVKFCNSVGLEVLSLCTESLSLARTILTSSNKQSLIIDIGYGTTSFNFYDSNDKINMSTIISEAGGQMTQAIVDKLKIEPVEADALKMKFGFKESADNTVRPIILPIIEDILNEAKQAIKYYEETFKQKLDDIYIIGGSSLMPGITELIKIKLGREVQVASSSYSINLKTMATKNSYFSLFANVIGLGMLGASGEFTDLNLLKKMPSSEVNSVNKLNLFSMGYLSKVNAFRSVMNNKFVLTVMIIMVGIIFAVLVQQVSNFGSTNTETTPAIVSKNIPKPGMPNIPVKASTTSPLIKKISTSTQATTSSKFVFTLDIDPGTYGESVTELQKRLTQDGYFKGLAGGFFGPATELALKEYQKANGIPDTGKIDSATRAKLNAK